jgi:hypothetical protein
LPEGLHERMQRHLAELQRAEAAARAHAEERLANVEGVRQDFQIVLPAMTFVAAAFSVQLPAVLVPKVLDGSVEPAWLAAEPVLVACAIVGAIACVQGYRSYRLAKAPRQVATVVPARCSSCGGGVPVAIGVACPCPFCGARLLPDPQTVARIEEAVAQRVAEEAVMARASRRWRRMATALLFPMAVVAIAFQFLGDWLGLG